MIWALLWIPALSGLAAFGIRRNVPRRALLLAAAVGHLAVVIACWRHAPPSVADGWIAVDPASLLFLGIASALFLAAAVYGVGYLAQSHHVAPTGEDEEELPFQNFPEAAFTGCLLLFLATMSLVAVSQHLGLMWVGVEATTLVSAPLIYFHRHHRSLEATWKYLVICSVGIALALLGNFFVAAAARSGGQTAIHLTMADLTAHANALNPRWLQAAFLFFLVGYGTKMGLAPLHTWLPDAHSEAPSVVSALLSGALLNCAFLTILRTHGLLAAAGLADFSSDLLVGFGLFSMAVAAVFIVGQADFKRMLAYSSVEHMGILSLGIGVGGAAAFGAMLHAVNHSLVKAMLFLAAGNILARYRTKSTVRVRGLLRLSPATGVLWMAGFLAIVGLPPFGPFLSELTILKGVFDAGRPWLAAGYLTALAVVFVGMAAICLRMSYGAPPDALQNPASPARREPLWSIAPVASLGALALLLGLYVPPPLVDLLHRAAVALGAH
ncbi:MAG: proton-conducting transporter membrane subunit [Thermoguttaceae bacterium]